MRMPLKMNVATAMATSTNKTPMPAPATAPSERIRYGFGSVSPPRKISTAGESMHRNTPRAICRASIRISIAQKVVGLGKAHAALAGRVVLAGEFHVLHLILQQVIGRDSEHAREHEYLVDVGMLAALSHLEID